jgi:transposase
MGVVLMSKRELNRIDVLARLDGGQLTTSAAADLMRVTLRQTHRLLKRYRAGGPPAIANRRRGRPSNNRLPDIVRDHAITLVREYYADFGPTLAAEKLGERHDVRVSRETLRGWMRQAGIWLPRAERKRIQQPRHRREHFGELIQIDGSDHRYQLQRVSHAAIVENKRLGEVLAWIKQQQDKQPHHRGDLVGPRRSNQKAGLMKDRVDRLAQGTKSRTRPARLGRRRCDSDVSAAPAQATSEAAE